MWFSHDMAHTIRISFHMLSMQCNKPVSFVHEHLFVSHCKDIVLVTCEGSSEDR